jgi:hypothetical protein
MHTACLIAQCYNGVRMVLLTYFLFTGIQYCLSKLYPTCFAHKSKYDNVLHDAKVNLNMFISYRFTVILCDKYVNIYAHPCTLHCT